MPATSSRHLRSIRREIRRYGNALRKVGTLAIRDWWDIVRAQAVLWRAQREVRTRPTGQMVVDDLARRTPAILDRMDDARRVALAVNRAAAFGFFRPRCLVRSMALRRLLDADGIEGAHVRVGVQLSEGAFVAHAWVEYAGEVVGDDPASVSRYTPLSGLHVVELD